MTAAVNPSAGPPAPKPQRFLVTGAGSGIGLAITQALAGQGHRVLAGARRDDDLAMLAQLANVTPLRLEVSDPTQVAAAAAHVAAAGGELHGLVQARGRVVCIGSQGGSITQPLYGPYTMSKFALEAFADCLGQEMAAHGVAVSIVQPGAVHTRIGATAGAANEARLRATPAPFDVDAARVLAAWSAPAPPQDDAGEESASRRKPATPEFVAEAVLHALLAATPLRRYLGGTRWEGERVLRALTARLVDAATSPSQQLTRASTLNRHCGGLGATRQGQPSEASCRVKFEAQGQFKQLGSADRSARPANARPHWTAAWTRSSAPRGRSPSPKPGSGEVELWLRRCRPEV